MKHNSFLCLLLSLFVFQNLWANPIDLQQAKQSAVHFMNTKNGNKKQALDPSQFISVKTPFDHLYLFNIKEGGFVIVSDNDKTSSILGYSTSNSIDTENLPEAFTAQLKKYNQQLQEISEGKAASPIYKSTQAKSVQPLIQTQWTQSTKSGLYNSELPIDSTLQKYGYHPTVGCSALALGQVMRYWEWPKHGRGSHCYSYDYECWKYDTLCADFENTTYDWENMPPMLNNNSSETERKAVGTLLYHCGISLDMMYNASCTGSSSSNMSIQHLALKNYWSYNPNTQMCCRADYDDNAWLTMIKKDLDDSMPILYRGSSYEDAELGILPGGHAFILDGYDENSFIHVNWGWGGIADGFFNLFSLTPLEYYNFSHQEFALFGLRPDTIGQAVLFPELSTDVVINEKQIFKGDSLHGSVDIINPNDTSYTCYVAQNIWSNADYTFQKWIDVQHITIPAKDTIHYTFAAPVDLPVGSYYTQLYFSLDSIDIKANNTLGSTIFPTSKNIGQDFKIVDSTRSELSNLVIFIRFADDKEIDYPFKKIDTMFNCKYPDYPSVYNYFDASTYGKIHFNTVYAAQHIGDSIISYTDKHPRAYYQAYSNSNPIGYTEANPMIGISMREAQLLAAAMDYVDSMKLVNESTMLDGDGDGYIDNISFIVKGQCNDWASLLWPHMEYFPQDSIDHEVTINGLKPNAFNFEFEGDTVQFNVNTFRHEMMHSLGVPDLYHYQHFTNVHITREWDVMGYHYMMNQTCMMNKYRYLRVADKPVQITEDGTYTLYSNGSSPTQSCYYIKSAIDSTQWFTFEYRNKEDRFDNGIPASGLIIGRWNNAIKDNIYANAFFDNDSLLHQYWIFRPESKSDTIEGNIADAYFSTAGGQTTFAPYTPMYPYLYDGTPEKSFEITEIQEHGNYLTFHVRFSTDNIDDPQKNRPLAIYPNPANSLLNINEEDMKTVEIFNAVGQLIFTKQTWGQNIISLNVSPFQSGIHFVRITYMDGSTKTSKFIKQ